MTPSTPTEPQNRGAGRPQLGRGLSALTKWVPATSWLAQYPRSDLRGDLSAGLTTAVMLIPQGMGYAMLAGLPPVYGLYAALTPIVIYSLYGTSRQLAVGPVAMDSLLVAAGVGTVAETGTEGYIAYALLLAAMVGTLQISMGLLRLGSVVNFLSQPVISGFTTAAALIIGLSQLKHLLGVALPTSNYINVTLLAAVERIDEVSWPTLAIGAGSIAGLMLLRRWRSAFPRALGVVVVGSLIVFLARLDQSGVAIVGEVPSGLPSFALHHLDLDVMQRLLPMAMTIALVGFMEAIAVAKALARRAGQDIDANQELFAIGAANLGSSFFGTYPITGGFSRSAVNAQAGAKSQLAGLITVAVVGATLLFLTPLFYYLPKAVLAAIIMTAVFGLVDLAEVRRLWKIKRSDLLLWGATFAATLAVGIAEGILIGVGVSLLVFVARTTRPHIAVLGRLPGTTTYRDVHRHPDAEEVPGMMIARLDAQFYFGNVSFLKESLQRREHPGVTSVVIDASGINQIDSSAEIALRDMLDDYRRRGIGLYLAGAKGQVLDVLERSGLLTELGEAHVFCDLHAAVERAAALGAESEAAPFGTIRDDGAADDTGPVAEQPAATQAVGLAVTTAVPSAPVGGDDRDGAPDGELEAPSAKRPAPPVMLAP